jgi:hypothetical protein
MGINISRVQQIRQCICTKNAFISPSSCLVAELKYSSTQARIFLQTGIYLYASMFLQINTFPFKWFVLYILHKIDIYSLNLELRLSCLVGSRCSAVVITNPLLFLHLHLLRYRIFIGAFAKAKSKY